MKMMKKIAEIVFYVLVTRYFLSFGSDLVFYFWVALGIFALLYDLGLSKS